jgi:hypothetical protein
VFDIGHEKDTLAGFKSGADRNLTQKQKYLSKLKAYFAIG